MQSRPCCSNTNPLKMATNYFHVTHTAFHVMRKRPLHNLYRFTIYEEFIDSEPCFPSCTDIKFELPEHITPVDKAFIMSEVLEMKLNEERAKEVACFYCDRCSELRKVVETQTNQLQFKAKSIHEKNQIRQFWRNKIL